MEPFESDKKVVSSGTYRLDFGDAQDRDTLDALLSAERSLVQLDALLADPDRRRRYWADARRREVLAAEHLAGRLVTWEDLVVAGLHPAAVDAERRPALRDAVDLAETLRWFEAQAGTGSEKGPEATRRVRPHRRGPHARAPSEAKEHDGPAPTGSAAETLAEVAALDAMVAALQSGDLAIETIDGDSFPAVESDEPAPAPGEDHDGAAQADRVDLLTGDGIQALLEQLAGRTDAGFATLSAQALPDLSSALKLPGVLAGAACLLSLWQDLDVRVFAGRLALGQEGDLGSGFADDRVLEVEAEAVARATRLLASAVLARQCGLRWGAPYLSPMLVQHGRGFELARLRSRLGPARHPLAWAVQRLADGLRAELARIAELDRIFVSWLELLPIERSTSRLPKILKLLGDQPAVSMEGLRKKLELTKRGGQLLFKALTKKDCVLREITGRMHDQIFVAHALSPDRPAR